MTWSTLIAGTTYTSNPSVRTESLEMPSSPRSGGLAPGWAKSERASEKLGFMSLTRSTNETKLEK